MPGEHQQEISKSLHDATGVDAAAIQKAVDRSIFVVQPVTDKVIATQQATADRFFKLGLIPKAVNVRDIVLTWTPGS